VEDCNKILNEAGKPSLVFYDKNNPNKVSNIWHLATIEPEYIVEDSGLKRALKKDIQDTRNINSCDFEMLERRFNCFVGPNYQTNEIESGIDRLTVIQPPYTEQGINKINNQTLSISQNRTLTKNAWDGEVLNGSTNVVVQTQVPKEKKVPVFSFRNVLIEAIILFAMLTVINVIINTISSAEYWGVVFVLGLGLLVLALTFVKVFDKITAQFSPKKSIKMLAKSILKTLQDIEEISGKCSVKIKYDDFKNLSVYITGASTREQNTFNTAITELLSPIQNPRYILIRINALKDYDYRCSFACPSVIGQKKESAKILQRYLQKYSGKLKLVYTRNEEGRKFILNCRKKSYITLNQKFVNKKYKVTNWE
jgi:hypothetical protein